MLGSYLTALCGIAVVMLFWVWVQGAWRRMFPDAFDDPDVLANRVGCRGCDRSEACKRTPAGGGTAEEDCR